MQVCCKALRNKGNSNWFRFRRARARRRPKAKWRSLCEIHGKKVLRCCSSLRRYLRTGDQHHYGGGPAGRETDKFSFEQAVQCSTCLHQLVSAGIRRKEPKYMAWPGDEAVLVRYSVIGQVRVVYAQRFHLFNTYTFVRKRIIGGAVVVIRFIARLPRLWIEGREVWG